MADGGNSTRTATDAVGETDAVGIAPQEYRDRIEKVRGRMVETGLDALLVTDPCNLYYLIGYNAWSFYMPQCLYITADGELEFLAREMDALGAGDTSWLPAEHVHPYPEALVHRPDSHPYEWIAARLRELGITDLPGPTIGMELDEDFLTPRGYLALASALPKCTLVDSHELVNWVRAVKSPAELELMRTAGTVTEHVVTTAIDALTSGRRQCDVVAEIQAAQAAGTPQIGGDYPAIVPLMATGKSAGTPHLTWSDKPLVHGETVVLELCGVHRRYHVPCARTVSLGTPGRDLARMADVVGEGIEAALGAVRPGVTAESVEAAWRTVLDRHGLAKASRIGYSIGIGYPPDWGEHTISLRPGDQTVLAEGMTFHLIVGMWMDGWGYDLSEAIGVTADGVERFTHLPQILTVKEA